MACRYGAAFSLSEKVFARINCVSETRTLGYASRLDASVSVFSIPLCSRLLSHAVVFPLVQHRRLRVLGKRKLPKLRQRDTPARVLSQLRRVPLQQPPGQLPESAANHADLRGKPLPARRGSMAWDKLRRHPQASWPSWSLSSG